MKRARFHHEICSWTLNGVLMRNERSCEKLRLRREHINYLTILNTCHWDDKLSKIIFVFSYVSKKMLVCIFYQ